MRVVAISEQDGAQLCARCTVADRPWTRMRGLLGRTGLPEGEGMLFPRTGSVHTMFMRFPIDVVFLDRALTVLSVKPGVQPWRAVKQKGAKWTLELAAAKPDGTTTAKGIAVIAAERA
jgi:uncharacterized membrane protein (UPF0127 family)